MVTMKELAKLCGFSRGTVDRALNGRGRIKKETADAIKRMAKEIGYEPNPAGKALSARRNHPTVAIILTSDGNAFFDEVMRGLQEAAADYAIYGLKVIYRTMRGYDAEKQCALIEEVKDKVSAVILNPIDDPAVAAAINKLVAADKFVVAVNTDIKGSLRHAYVGTDYINGGETACALLAALNGENSNVGVVMGSKKVLGHRLRLEGFRRRQKGFNDLHIVEVIENEDDDILSYERTGKLLKEHPNINSLFIVAGGVYGAGRAVMARPVENRPLVIAFDSVPATIEMMRLGIIRAILYQHPYRQGHLSMDLAFEYLVNGREPAKKEYILKNEIRLPENAV